MLISRSWLQDYIDLSDLSDKDLAQTLIDLGLEVEKISIQAGLDHGVVVGEIIEVVPHPYAESLNLCQVSIGAAKPLSIVCGAHNVKKNLRVAVATLGSMLPGEVTIKAAKIRGIASEGMICSVRELHLGDEHEGIWQVDSTWPVGEKIATLLGSDETIFELSITPNRGDCLSYVGIARDLAAKLDRPLRYPEIAELPTSKIRVSEVARVEVAAEAACARFASVYIKGLKAVASPAWVQKRLLASGMRPINLIVDATNYGMLELGQPIHAYDHRLVKGGLLRVHPLGKQTTIPLLDGKEVLGLPDDLVISDAEQVLGLAGVMGGAVAEVGDATTEVLIEVAHFAPACIRATAKRLGLTTDAAMRFERGTDQTAIAQVIKRVAELIRSWGKEVGLTEISCSTDFLDYYPEPLDEAKIAMRLPRVRRLLGLYDLTVERCTTLLESLELRLLDSTEERMLFAVPHFRHDIQREIDLIEEVARMLGYAAIPYQLPQMTIQPTREDPFISFGEQVRVALAHMGLSEAITFPFVGSDDLDKLQIPAAHPLRKPVRLANALSEDTSFMQGNTVAGLVHAVARNRRYGHRGARLFESARGYLPAGEQPRELHLIGGIIDAPLLEKSWCDTEVEPGFFHAKGLIESLCARFGCKELSWQPIVAHEQPWLHPAAAAEVLVGETVLGWVGELHPLAGVACELGNDLPVLFELDTRAFFAATEALKPSYVLARRFPPVVRDFALLADEGVTYQELVAAIHRYPEQQYLHDLNLFDLYRGVGIPAGKKSIALSISFAAEGKTLTDQEVDRESTGLLAWLEKNLGVVLRVA